MPLPKSKERITLEEVNAPEFFVEWKILGGLPYREVQALFANDDENDMEAVANMFSRLIINWNIPEVEGGEILPLPSQDKSSVGKLPALVVNFMSMKIAESANLERGDESDLVKETDSS